MTNENYDWLSETYQWSIKTNYYWVLEFKLKKTPKKETQWGWIIVWQMLLIGEDWKQKEFAIRENLRNDWSKSYSSTIKKWLVFLNYYPKDTSSWVKDYKIVVVEVKSDDQWGILFDSDNTQTSSDF